MKRLLWVLLLLVGRVPGIDTAAGGAPPRGPADEIVKASGVRGGLCVHLGATDGELTAALGAGGFLVQGLTADADALEKARKHIQGRDLYGRASVVRCNFKRLPYADDLVNLAVAEDLPALLRAGLDLKEVARCLVPNGVLCFGGRLEAGILKAAGFKDVKTAGSWTVAVKPRPKEMDDWPSFNHGPDQNPVSQDLLIGPAPTRLRWYNFSPWWSRDQVLAWASAGGRLFYVPKYSSANYLPLDSGRTLIAVDAHNGLLLWRRPLRTGREGVMGGRLLSVTADRVYLPIDDSGVLAALDAGTGKLVRTYKQAGRVTGFLHHEGKLFTRGRSSGPRGSVPSGMAIDAETGEVLWKDSPVGVDLIAAGRGYGVLYGDQQDKLACVDLGTGKVRWRAPLADPSDKYSRPRYFHYRGALVFTPTIPRIKGQRERKVWVAGYSPEDGRLLWEYKPEDLKSMVGKWGGHIFGAQGLVWANVELSAAPGTGNAFGGRRRMVWVGIDPASGKEKVRHDVAPAGISWFHHFHRCGKARATERFFLGGTYDFIDWKSGQWHTSNVVRSGCQAGGILPANGLIYTPDRHCSCRNFMQKGFTVMAPARPVRKDTSDRLVLGPAAGTPIAAAGAAKEGDWPMYRHDRRRSGATRSPVPAALKPLWEAPAGRGLTAPTIAEGMAFVASMDEHRVWALDADTGQVRWSYMAGGPIDSPPTVRAGLAVFGCRDGHVCCLRAKDGELAWRFRAAPTGEQIVVDGRLESAWPVHGSVLVLGEVAYFAAGWHTGLDGGVSLYAVKLGTGEGVWEKRYERIQPRRFEGSDRPVALLTSDGDTIFMGKAAVDPKDGRMVRRRSRSRVVDFGYSGFRDTCWWSHENGRANWSDGRITARMVVSGREACGIFPQWPLGSGGWAGPISLEHLGLGLYALCGKRRAGTRNMDWVVRVPSVRMKAMALAGEAVFVAGRSDDVPELSESGQSLRKDGGKNNWRKLRPQIAKVTAGLPEERLFPKDGRLMAFSTTDGRKLGEWKLPAPPVFDGLAAANGRLYLTCLDGQLRCFAGRSAK